MGVKDVEKTENGTRFRLTNNWKEENQSNGIFTVNSVEIPANKIVCLVGCNGIGKSTTLEEMKQFLEVSGVKDIGETRDYNPIAGIFSEIKEDRGGKISKPSGYLTFFDKEATFVSTKNKGDGFTWMQKSDLERIFGSMSSNGESVIRRLNGAIEAIGVGIKKALNDQVPLWIFIDDVDAGTSIDVICEVKAHLVEVDEYLNKKGLEHYIIVTANSFEFAKDLYCLYARTMEPITFTQYDEFKEFVLKTRKDKERRDGLEK